MSLTSFPRVPRVIGCCGSKTRMRTWSWSTHCVPRLLSYIYFFDIPIQFPPKLPPKFFPIYFSDDTFELLENSLSFWFQSWSGKLILLNCQKKHLPTCFFDFQSQVSLKTGFISSINVSNGICLHVESLSVTKILVLLSLPRKLSEV